MTLTRVVRRRFKLTVDFSHCLKVFVYSANPSLTHSFSFFVLSFGKMANLEMFACSSCVLINTSEMSVSQSSCVTVYCLVAV